MKTSKKILSLVLSIIMIACTVPMAYAEEVAYKTGDIIQFGSYPQSEVTDEVLLAELNALAPEWDDWTSYGYYSGEDESGTMIQGDWMRYSDIEHNGSKYRGVKFTQYRPNYIYFSKPRYKNHQSINGYNTNIVYWFKFEPIDWRILDPVSGLVVSENIIDSQPYSNTIYKDSTKYLWYNDALCSDFASDYESSSVRNWLNNNFYNTAFSDSDKKEINYSTKSNESINSIETGKDSYDYLDSNPTTDKIFLLSHDEIINSTYGFDPKYLNFDAARRASGSDYAKSQGLWVYESSDRGYGNSSWLLRTPGYETNRSGGVGPDGQSSGNFDVSVTYFGIRPALAFNNIYNLNHKHNYTYEIATAPTHLAEGVKTFTCTCGDSYIEIIAKLESHTYKTTVTAPTCTGKGYTTYTCECGDSYTETIDAKGHSYNGSVCSVCGYDKADSCSCNCHKGGIAAFFFKLINFFQKLFGMNKVCECGVKH